MIFQTEKALGEVGDKIDANEKATVEADIQALKDILAKSTPENITDAQVEEIKAGKEKLMTSAHDANEKATVEADIQALKDILAKSTPENITDAQVEEIKAGKEKLMTSAQQLFTKMYEQAGAGAQQAGPTPEQQAGPAPEGFNGDDVVDGDYKEV